MLITYMKDAVAITIFAVNIVKICIVSLSSLNSFTGGKLRFSGCTKIHSKIITFMRASCCSNEIETNKGWGPIAILLIGTIRAKNLVPKSFICWVHQFSWF